MTAVVLLLTWNTLKLLPAVLIAFIFGNGFCENNYFTSFELLDLSSMCIIYLGSVLRCGATCKLHKSTQIWLIDFHLIKCNNLKC